MTKLVQFQISNNTLYALDDDGTIWRNSIHESSSGWVPLPGPTAKQHDKEDLAIRERIRIDISDRSSEKNTR